MVGSLACLGDGPVGLVHTQNFQFFKKEKPTSWVEKTYACDRFLTALKSRAAEPLRCFVDCHTVPPGGSAGITAHIATRASLKSANKLSDLTGKLLITYQLELTTFSQSTPLYNQLKVLQPKLFSANLGAF